MKRTLTFRILTILYLCAIGVLCFANFSGMTDVPETLFGIPADKIVHFLMFLPFPVLVFFSFRLSGTGVVKSLLLIIAIFAVGCLFAWGTEYVQGLLPYRDMDMEDFKADRLGLACGSLITFFVRLLFIHKADA